MKNVLLLVHDDPGQEARLQVALDLTRALGGHLTCVDVTVPIVVIGDLYGTTEQATLLQIEREKEARNKAAIEQRLANEDVSWTWLDQTDTVSDAVLDAAMLADVIVLNRKLDSTRHPDMLDIASRVVMRARKPVVAVPEAYRQLALDRALVAWDGQAPCATTLRACVPLLALAKEVEIFMVGESSDRTDPAEAAEYLSRHGVHAEVRVIAPNDEPADARIAEECDRWRADYVVMGAYGRGRLMETFGGVTKRLLATSKVPLILGH